MRRTAGDRGRFGQRRRRIAGLFDRRESRELNGDIIQRIPSGPERSPVFIEIQAVCAEPEEYLGIVIRCVDVLELVVPVNVHFHRPVVEHVQRLVRVVFHRLPRFAIGDVVQLHDERLFIGQDVLVRLRQVPFPLHAWRGHITGILFDAHGRYAKGGILRVGRQFLPLASHEIEIGDPDERRVRVHERHTNEPDVFEAGGADDAGEFPDRDAKLIVVLPPRIAPPDDAGIPGCDRIERQFVLKEGIRLVEVTVGIDILRVRYPAARSILVVFRPVDVQKIEVRADIRVGV